MLIIPQALVVEMKLKTGEPSKKPKNGDLPDGIDYKVWRHIFVPTFMKWVSQQDNPFEHNPKCSCEAMQNIWDALFDEVPYMVVPSSAVYALVSIISILLGCTQMFKLFFVTDCTTSIRLLAKHHRLNSNCGRACLLHFAP